MWVKNAQQSHGNQAFLSDATAFGGKLFKFLVEVFCIVWRSQNGCYARLGYVHNKAGMFIFGVIF